MGKLEGVIFMILFAGGSIVGWYLNLWAEIAASGSGGPSGLLSGGFKFLMLLSTLTLLAAMHRGRGGWALLACVMPPVIGGIGSWIAVFFVGHWQSL